MISKELFCEFLTRRDAEFNKICAVSRVLEDIFETSNGKILDTDSLFSPLDLACDILTAVFYDPQNLLCGSLGLEDTLDNDFTEMEAKLIDGTVTLIRSYADLYDYLVARREQIEANNQ